MRALRVLPAGGWDPARQSDQVSLTFDLPHRRRIALTTDTGAALLLDLAQTQHLRDGDGLETDAGGVIRVAALAEPLLELTAPDPAALARLAWHLGNRHLPVQILSGALRIRPDHVIADMARGLGAAARALSAPFDPETGAYAAGPHDHHDHHHHHHD